MGKTSVNGREGTIGALVHRGDIGFRLVRIMHFSRRHSDSKGKPNKAQGRLYLQ